MFVRPGDTVSTDKLLKGMIALCANDAALTLADRLGNGSIENFVQQMNKEARRLGMKNTVFKTRQAWVEKDRFPPPKTSPAV